MSTINVLFIVVLSLLTTEVMLEIWAERSLKHVIGRFDLEGLLSIQPTACLSGVAMGNTNTMNKQKVTKVQIVQLMERGILD